MFLARSSQTWVQLQLSWWFCYWGKASSSWLRYWNVKWPDIQDPYWQYCQFRQQTDWVGSKILQKEEQEGHDDHLEILGPEQARLLQSDMVTKWSIKHYQVREHSPTLYGTGGRAARTWLLGEINDSSPVLTREKAWAIPGDIFVESCWGFGSGIFQCLLKLP